MATGGIAESKLLRTAHHNHNGVKAMKIKMAMKIKIKIKKKKKKEDGAFRPISTLKRVPNRKRRDSNKEITAFTKDLLTNPASRNVHDVSHEVVAAASSSAQQRAVDFLKKVGAPEAAKAYGSYHELVADADVDIIYVATPHSHHFQNAMLALEAGKHVLCEKALTVNAAQARKLFATAAAKKVFFMEAVWTRFFPLSIKVREMIQSGTIGTVYRAIGKQLPRGRLVSRYSHGPA
jgi:hypothetical protein